MAIPTITNIPNVTYPNDGKVIVSNFDLLTQIPGQQNRWRFDGSPDDTIGTDNGILQGTSEIKYDLDFSSGYLSSPDNTGGMLVKTDKLNSDQIGTVFARGYFDASVLQPVILTSYADSNNFFEIGVVTSDEYAYITYNNAGTVIFGRTANNTVPMSTISNLQFTSNGSTWTFYINGVSYPNINNGGGEGYWFGDLPAGSYNTYVGNTTRATVCNVLKLDNVIVLNTDATGLSDEYNRAAEFPKLYLDSNLFPIKSFVSNQEIDFVAEHLDKGTHTIEVENEDGKTVATNFENYLLYPTVSNWYLDGNGNTIIEGNSLDTEIDSTALVCYYYFGDLYIDGGFINQDFSGHGNDLYRQNLTNDSSSLNQYKGSYAMVCPGNYSAYTLGSTTQNNLNETGFTISFPMRKVNTSYGIIVNKLSTAGYTCYTNADGSIGFYLRDSNNNVKSIDSGYFKIANSSHWHEYTVTWSGVVNESPRIYFNGVDCTNVITNNTFTGTIASTDTFSIGDTHAGTSSGFHGDLTIFKIYDRALTDIEVKRNVNFSMLYLWPSGTDNPSRRESVITTGLTKLSKYQLQYNKEMYGDVLSLYGRWSYNSSKIGAQATRAEINNSVVHIEGMNLTSNSVYDTNLEAHYRFVSGSNTFDSSGNGRTMSINGATQALSHTIYKDAVDLDSGDYLSIPHISITNGISICFGMFNQNYNDTSYVLGKGDNDSNITYQIQRILKTSTSGIYRFTLWDSTGNMKEVESPTIYYYGNAQHYAFTWSGVGSEAPKIYVNGEEYSYYVDQSQNALRNDDFGTNVLRSNTANTLIGRRYIGTSESNNFNIGDVRIYSEGLSASQVKEIAYHTEWYLNGTEINTTGVDYTEVTSTSGSPGDTIHSYSLEVESEVIIEIPPVITKAEFDINLNEIKITGSDFNVAEYNGTQLPLYDWDNASTLIFNDRLNSPDVNDVNNPIYDIGRYENSLKLNGINQYRNVGNSAWSGNNNFLFSIWIYLPDDTNNYLIATRGKDANIGFYLGVKAGKLECGIFDGLGASASTIDNGTNGIMNIGWNLVGCSWASTDQYPTIWRNDINLQGIFTGDMTGKFLDTTNTELILGGHVAYGELSVSSTMDGTIWKPWADKLDELIILEIPTPSNTDWQILNYISRVYVNNQMILQKNGYDNIITIPASIYGEGDTVAVSTKNGISNEVVVVSSNNTPTDISIDSNSITENESIGTLVGSFSTTDVDIGDTFTYTLVTGIGDTDNSSFQISGDQLQSNEIFDKETKDVYSVRIRSTDSGGLFTEKQFTINIINVNEVPTDILLDNNTIAENESIGTIVGILASIDPDTGDTFTYSLVNGSGSTGNASFTIVGDQLQSNEIFDFETKSTYYIRIRSTDSSSLYLEKEFVINITNVNEVPTDITLDNDTVNDSISVGTTIGRFSTIDPDIGVDIHTYTLVNGIGDTDNNAFTINANELKSAITFNYDTQSVFLIRVRSTDPTTQYIEKTFIINIIDSISNITDILIDNSNITEGVKNGTIVGHLTVINDNIHEIHTLEMIDDAGGRFQLENFDVVVRDTTLIDYETETTHDITIRAYDTSNNYMDKLFTIIVIDSNSATIIYSISPSTSKVGTHPEIIITGHNFTEGGPPIVRIDGSPIYINSYTDNEIRFVLTENLSADVYKITVFNGLGL